jgi:DNA topoisomerase III
MTASPSRSANYVPRCGLRLDQYENHTPWRLSEARRRRVPAFRILTDKVLGAIASSRPRDSTALQRIHGVGPKLAERYGEAILALVGRMSS